MLHKAVTTGHKGQSTLLVSLSPVDNRRCMTLARQKCADRTGASFDKGGEFFFNQLKDNGNENFYWLFQSYLTTEL
jgi:hypothetical protein